MSDYPVHDKLKAHKAEADTIGRLHVIAAGAIGGTATASRAAVEELVEAGQIVCIGDGDSRLCWSVEGWAEVTARAAAVEEAIATLARHGVKARGLSGGVVIAEGEMGNLNRALGRLPE